MKSDSAHHLLSAYLDGELSPGERDEVERLLSESPAAWQELKELEQIRELLRQLPRENLPNTFASRILQECQKTSPASAPAAMTSGNKKTAAAYSGASAAGKRNGWWMRLASLAVSVAAVLVIVWFSFPDSRKEHPAEMTQQTPQNGLAANSQLEEKSYRASPPNRWLPQTEK